MDFICRFKDSIDALIRVSNSLCSIFLGASFVIFFHIAVGSVFHFIAIHLIFDMNIVVKGYRKVILNE